MRSLYDLDRRNDSRAEAMVRRALVVARAAALCSVLFTVRLDLRALGRLRATIAVVVAPPTEE